MPGAKTSFWHQKDDIGGSLPAYHKKAVGVLKGGDDWSCMGKMSKLIRDGAVRE